VLLDPRLWLLIGLSLAMLFTLEAIEEFVEGAWPQMRRPANGWGAVGSTHTMWAAVALFMLPGLVLTILNLAILVANDLPYANAQLLGTIFVVIGSAPNFWMSAALVKNVAGKGAPMMCAARALSTSAWLMP